MGGRRWEGGDEGPWGEEIGDGAMGLGLEVDEGVMLFLVSFVMFLLLSFVLLFLYIFTMYVVLCRRACTFTRWQR